MSLIIYNAAKNTNYFLNVGEDHVARETLSQTNYGENEIGQRFFSF